MKLLARVQTLLGVAAAAVLAALVVNPGLVPLPDTAGLDVSSTGEVRMAVAAGLGLATAVVALVSQLRSPTATDDGEPLVVDPPEEIHGRATGHPRPDVDERFDRLADGDADTETVAALSADLRETAVRVYAAAAGCSRDAAADAIDAGEWTDDRRAAAFVARDAAPLPLRVRLWDYVRTEDADHRRARRAVEALEALSTGDAAPGTEGTSETAPETEGTSETEPEGVDR